MISYGNFDQLAASRRVDTLQLSISQEVTTIIRVGQQEIDAVTRVLQSGDFFRYSWNPEQKSEVEQFEEEWSRLVGTQYTLGVTSGTAALFCACAGLGIGPGDEVIVPGYTFIATAIAPLMCGAIPVLAEVNDTLLLDPDDLEQRISPRTKAIIPVHMLGMPCDMDPIMAIARKHHIAVIEDACQMDTGSYKGQRAGSIGDVGCFSFNLFKFVMCGEGGALSTNDHRIYSRAMMMHDGGASFWPTKDQADMPFFIGLEFRMNGILAAILRAQLHQSEEWLAAGRRIKGQLVAELTEAGVRTVPSNDLAGDLGITLGIQFDTEDAA
ncbi:MAG TPA: aminotransferase class V-fold PLP-dependent enzyme, partial [Armatimonadota bacterium]|nr:aminotransferase class V-fold PLP-dependent enzyme [Armatimonadota bacterium]